MSGPASDVVAVHGYDPVLAAAAFREATANRPGIVVHDSEPYTCPICGGCWESPVWIEWDDELVDVVARAIILAGWVGQESCITLAASTPYTRAVLARARELLAEGWRP